jgi:hypothetical protein
MKTKIKDEHNHVVSNIPNTEENRNKITTLNKLAKKSNSMHRFFIKYRKPIKGIKYSCGGGVKKTDATTFSVYLKYTTMHQCKLNNQRDDRMQGYYDLRNKYNNLKNKYNTLKLNEIITGLLSNVEELSYALEKGEHSQHIINSLHGISESINDDINNTLEQ